MSVVVPSRFAIFRSCAEPAFRVREPGKTICPSEAARAVGGDDWRDLMQPARDGAHELVGLGEVEVTQKGEVVDVTTARGPVRIRRAR